MNTDLIPSLSQDLSPKNSTEKSIIGMLQSTLEQYQNVEQEMTAIIEDHHKNNIDKWGDTPPKTIHSFDLERLDKLSRIKEREFKQFVNALQTLKQLQAPPLQVNIKTNATYIAQNQQNNVSKSMTP